MPAYSDEISSDTDVDVFEVDLEAGSTYYIDLWGDPEDPDALPDSYLRLFSGDTEIDGNDDGGVGLNSRIVFTPTTSGVYAVEASGYQGATGGYWLRVEEDDHPDSIEGEGDRPVAGGGVGLPGTIDFAGDIDTFGVTFIRGLTYNIEVLGEDSGEGTLADPYLDVIDENGDLIAGSDNGGGTLDPLLEFDARGTGRQYLAVSSSDLRGTGDYTLVVSQGFATEDDDIVSGSSDADFVRLLDGDDTARGRNGDDEIVGGRGDDRALGGAGADLLRGNADEDVLLGNSGADTLVGGRDADRLIGGRGEDTFLFESREDSRGNAADAIQAASNSPAFAGAGRAGGDVIDLSMIDANQRAEGDQAFRFDSESRGGLIVTFDEGNTVVLGNTDRDADWEFQLVIEDGAVRSGVYTADDFVL